MRFMSGAVMSKTVLRNNLTRFSPKKNPDHPHLHFNVPLICPVHESIIMTTR